MPTTKEERLQIRVGPADADDLVVAYVSVAMTGIDRSAAPEIVAKGAPDPVPALLLGRLAVDRRYANLGIGTALAAHVLATAVELNEKRHAAPSSSPR